VVKSYRGGCHCGTVRFEADLDLTQPTFRCNRHHFFCKRCGVRAFGVGNDTPIGKMHGVNLGCLDDVSEEELSCLRITYVDGLHDRWDRQPEFVEHL
jgi:hypothetical protein